MVQNELEFVGIYTFQITGLFTNKVHYKINCLTCVSKADPPRASKILSELSPRGD